VGWVAKWSDGGDGEMTGGSRRESGWSSADEERRSTEHREMVLYVSIPGPGDDGDEEAKEAGDGGDNSREEAALSTVGNNHKSNY
jgi:hypothetical protein